MTGGDFLPFIFAAKVNHAGMKITKLPLFLFILCLCFDHSAYSKGGSHMMKAFASIKEDAIVAVSADSITISHEKIGAKGKDVETIERTYKITPATEIQVNGEKSTSSALSAGMAANVTGDEPRKGTLLPMRWLSSRMPRKRNRGTRNSCSLAGGQLRMPVLLPILTRPRRGGHRRDRRGFAGTRRHPPCPRP